MRRLKTSWIVIANVALMSAILVFVALYSNYERKGNYRSQVDHFVNATVAMEQVTGNYLEGEQGICDNWAQYIDSRDLTLAEAAAYIRPDRYGNPDRLFYAAEAERRGGL